MGSGLVFSPVLPLPRSPVLFLQNPELPKSNHTCLTSFRSVPEVVGWSCSTCSPAIRALRG
jgi:hypothetical protein